MRDEAERTQTEAKLLDASLRGDIDAFAELYAGYRAALVRHCTQILKDVGLAEDAVQETFLRAFTCLPRFDVERQLWPWLATIAQRLAIDVLRGRAYTVCSDDHEGAFAASRLLGPEHPDEPFEAVVAGETRAELARALETLSPRQRRTLLMRAVEEWPYSDIASAESTSVSSVKSTLFRARARLRETFVASGMLGVIGIPFRPARRLLERARVRMRQSAASHMDGLVQGGGLQFVNTVTAVALVVGGLVAPGSSAAAAPAFVTVAYTPPAVAHAGGGSSNVRADRVPAPQEPSVTDVITELTDPTKEVKDPEDAQIASITMSPNFERDHTIFAAGVARCVGSCSPVLFRSTDAGATWTRLQASGLAGTALLLPPAYGEGDSRIFAMAPSGLQVSKDAGRTFQFVGLVSSDALSGSAAMSPAFDDADPRILIGAQVLLGYNDDVETITPEPSTALPGPLRPAFAPAYPVDPRLVIGGWRGSASQGGLASAVFVCSGVACSETTVPGIFDLPPAIRLPDGFAQSNRAYAFTGNSLFSLDVPLEGAAKVAELVAPFGDGDLNDLVVSPDGTGLFAAIGPGEAKRGIYRSWNGGRTWQRLQSKLLTRGVVALSMQGSVLVAALADRGLACSADGGKTWAQRCA
jgi:RNA polymerase sigma-70 factor (ECF subfamily)